MHHYKKNIKDWAYSTAHLTPEEEGVYLRLVEYCYDTEGGIPQETQWVLRRLRLAGYEETVNAILQEFFTLENGFWVNKRVSKELSEYAERVAANRRNGVNGGRPKKEEPDKPTKNPMGKKSKPKKTLTTNHKPLTNIPNGINGDAFWEFVEYREEMKKPLTERAAKKTWNFMANYSPREQQNIVDETIRNNWQGLFAPKGGQRESNREQDQKLTPAQRVRAKAEAAAGRSGSVGNVVSDG